MLCIWFGFMFQLIPMFIPRGGAIFEALHVLPWGFIGVIWLVVGLGIVVYRGKKTGYWIFLDFPVPGTVNDLHIDKLNMHPIRLFKSRIEGLLKNKDGSKYFKDPPKASLFSAGHEARISKDGIIQTLNVDYVLLTQELDEKGIHTAQQMKDEIKRQMIQLKQEDEKGEETDKYLLTGKTEPLPIAKLDIENNPLHKQVFDEISKQAKIVVDGTTVSFYHYNNFQKALGSSVDMASAIDYVRSDEAAKAAKIRKNISGGGWKLILVVVAIVIVIFVLVLIFSGGGPPGLIPGR